MLHRWMLLLLPALAASAQAAPLSYQAALDRAEREAPSVAAKAAQVEADKEAASAAASLPDPKLFVGVDNLPTSGADRWSLTREAMTMQKIGLMQEVPNADKRRARAAAAAAAVARSEAERRIERNRVRRETALAWITRYYIERRRQQIEALQSENAILFGAARAQIAAGRGPAADAVSARQETAQLADRSDDIERDLIKAKASLRRYVGSDGDDELSGDPPPFPVDAATLRRHVQRHPELQAFTPQAQLADAELREAEATKQPDWGVELAYQRRAPQFGDMISVQFSFELPLFGATRQDPQIAAKRGEAARVEREREAMLRDHVADLDGDLAEYAALDRQLERMRQAWLPLAQEKVDLQFAAYRGGRGDLAALLTARRELIEARMKAIDIEAQRKAAAARLYFAYGEDTQ